MVDERDDAQAPAAVRGVRHGSIAGLIGPVSADSPRRDRARIRALPEQLVRGRSRRAGRSRRGPRLIRSTSASRREDRAVARLRRRAGKHVVGPIQWALGCYERFLHRRRGAVARLRAGARDRLCASSARTAGGARLPLPAHLRLEPPWLSGMAQGEGASLLVRLHAETGDERYAEAARRALGPMARPGRPRRVGRARRRAGARGVPDRPAVAGPQRHDLRPLGAARRGPRARRRRGGRAFQAGVEALAGRSSAGTRALVALRPAIRTRSATSRASAITTSTSPSSSARRARPRPALAEAAARWAGYAASRANRARAWGAKIAFRVAVPRSPRVAGALPWARRRRAAPAEARR